MYKFSRLTSIALSLAASACGRPSGSAHTKEAIDSANRPVLLPNTGAFEMRPALLPESGYSTQTWSGDYWPDSKGGTAQRKNSADQSPMEKYDAATNKQGLATTWELAEAARNNTVNWAGHCNGLAAAGIKTREPQHGVTYHGVAFSTDDVKALLIEAWMGNGALAGRRCDLADVKLDRYGRPVVSSCRDLNPATFHIVATNYLGLHHRPVIIDNSSGVAVWNRQLIGYRYTHRVVSVDEANQLLGAEQGSYPFNPEARHFLAIHMEVDLLLGAKTADTYDYILEGSDNGDIIGGEWIGASKLAHPDFIWDPGNTPSALNPNLDIGVIKDIYNLSL